MFLKTLSSIAVIFLYVEGFSQPVLESSSFNTSIYGNYYSAPTTGYTNGTPGENIWDYSSLPLTLSGSMKVVPPETVPFHEHFPTANYCLRTNDFSEGVYYNYFLLNESSYQFIGFARNDSFSDYTNDPLLVMQLPYAYGSTFNDTFISNGLGQGTFYTRTYDAYGTMITPYGEFNNVIRQKIVSQGNTRYLWFSTNPYYVILYGNFENDTVTFFEELSLGIQQQANEPFRVYPNPSKGDFFVSNAQGINAKATVYDLQGRAVIHLAELSDNSLVCLKNCSDGIYFLKIVAEGQQVAQTIKLIKQ